MQKPQPTKHAPLHPRADTTHELVTVLVASDPIWSPLTSRGQVIFGIGLGIRSGRTPGR